MPNRRDILFLSALPAISALAASGDSDRTEHYEKPAALCDVFHFVLVLQIGLAAGWLLHGLQFSFLVTRVSNSAGSVARSDKAAV